jgi:hypothetical protein
MAYIQDINLPIVSDTKIITNYVFKPQQKEIIINEQFDNILYIFCLENNQMIYNPTAKGFGGVCEEDKLFIDYDVTTYDSFFNLLIVANLNKGKEIEILLKALVNEQNKTNQLLKLILT